MEEKSESDERVQIDEFAKRAREDYVRGLDMNEDIMDSMISEFSLRF